MRAGVKVNGAHCDFYQNTLRVESHLGRRVSLATFQIEGEETWATASLAIAPVNAFGGFTNPAGKQEVKIFRAPAPYETIAIVPATAMGGNATYLDDFFGGYIGDVETQIIGVRRTYRCVAQDYNILPAQVLVTKSYTTQTAKQIIDDLFTTYLPEISTTEVAAGGSTITIDWTRVSLDKALDELAAIFGREWYIRHDKKFYWVVPASGTAPFTLSDAPYLTVAIPYSEHSHRADHSRIVNKVTVVGDTTVPIVVVRTDATSYALYGKYFEDKIVDGNINTVAWANLVGDAYLTENAAAKVIGHLVCLQEGLVVGQKVRVINALKQIDAYYTVQAVILSMVGGLTERVEVSYGDYRPGLVDMLLSLKRLETKET